MSDEKYLLSDAQMQRFIVDGYILVHTDSSASMHRNIYQKLEEVFAKEGNVGNNILPRIPEIQQVYDHPAMRGALHSLLGPDYIMNPHRHCHLNPTGSKGQGWHKDCYVWDHNTRHPRFHWLLALYYPQDVSEDMGPTGLLPGQHLYEWISDPDPNQCTEEVAPMCGPAGTVALVHFDAWHRAMPNISDRKRYMLKFQFARLQEPREPCWDHRQAAWDPPTANRAVALDVWNWLRGCPDAPPSDPVQKDAARLLEELQEGAEALRLHAAFALGSRGAGVVPQILEALRREAREVVDRIEAKTADNAHGTNPTACRAAQALVAVGAAGVPQVIAALADEHWLVRAALIDVLATLGPSAAAAIPALQECLGDEHWWVRRNAVEALGRMGATAAAAAPLLVAALRDEDRRVRRMAALALALIGRYAPGATENLGEVLQDEDRYNRFYAGLALRRLDHPEARKVLLDSLTTARWCPLTTSETTF